MLTIKKKCVLDFLKKIGSLHEIGIKGNFMDTEKNNKWTAEWYGR